MPRVLSQRFGNFHMAYPQRLLTSSKGLLPCGVGVIFARVDGDKVSDSPTENTLGWGEFSTFIGSVAVLKHGSLECIGV